jgi:hypothetical protein
MYSTYSKQDCDNIIAFMKKRTEELVAAGPRACLEYLIDLGIYNADGSLHENYGGLPNV